MSPNQGSATPGRLYRVGKDWYVDTALLGRFAQRLVVEPMQGGYQILAPAGLVRCMPSQGLALPGQTGGLFRCQDQRQSQDVGGRLRNLASSLGEDTLGGEWDAWPGEPAVTSSCCHACSGGGAACSTSATPTSNVTASQTERLVVSETLGTVATRTQPDGSITILRTEHAAPEWACGRYHECIGSILRFPDLAADEPIAHVRFAASRTDITWTVVLDRQRRTMLAEILALVGSQLRQIARVGSVQPGLPPRTTPGYGVWDAAVLDANPKVSCSLCPYRLGTNLRCPTCRTALLAGERKPASDQARAVTKILGEQNDLDRLHYLARTRLGAAIAASHASNPHAPLTDAFFVRLERDVLTAVGDDSGMTERELSALLETAELTPLDRSIAVGAAARSAS